MPQDQMCTESLNADEAVKAAGSDAPDATSHAAGIVSNDASDAPAPAQEEVTRTSTPGEQAQGEGQESQELFKRILHGLGFCGRYLHYHGGGNSGRIPIICELDRSGGMLPQQELNARFDLKPGSLSEILSKLEAAGLIERTRNEQDRRQLFVHLTDAGCEQAQREHEERRAFRNKAFTCLSVEEQEQLADMLDRIRTTWKEIDD